MNILTDFLKNNIKLIVVIFVAAVILAYFFNSSFLKKTGGHPQSSSQSLGQEAAYPFCDVTVEQPRCYDKDFPAPTFKWKYCDEASAKDQKYFQVQISDQAYYNSAFPAVKIDTQKTESSETKYSVDEAGLDFDKQYYWGVTIEDSKGVKSGWWGWGDRFFKTAPSCDRAKQ